MNAFPRLFSRPLVTEVMVVVFFAACAAVWAPPQAPIDRVAIVTAFACFGLLAADRAFGAGLEPGYRDRATYGIGVALWLTGFFVTMDWVADDRAERQDQARRLIIFVLVGLAIVVADPIDRMRHRFELDPAWTCPRASTTRLRWQVPLALSMAGAAFAVDAIWFEEGHPLFLALGIYAAAGLLTSRYRRRRPHWQARLHGHVFVVLLAVCVLATGGVIGSV